MYVEFLLHFVKEATNICQAYDSLWVDKRYQLVGVYLSTVRFGNPAPIMGVGRLAKRHFIPAS